MMRRFQQAVGQQQARGRPGSADTATSPRFFAGLASIGVLEAVLKEFGVPKISAALRAVLASRYAADTAAYRLDAGGSLIDYRRFILALFPATATILAPEEKKTASANHTDKHTADFLVTFSFLCQLLEKYGTFIARCNALIEKVSPCRQD
eukprot:SAG31_NODE_1320_length_8809_cov_4.243398_11_plen_151_part_00